ncbi:ADP-ribose pyrophosphatase [bacterium BMS3Bbin10]|nr:ADP-ribose pyrophosphatase [bacterium BMS3Bbin10]
MLEAGDVDDHSQAAALERYFSLLQAHPEWFENHNGGIELLTGVNEIRAAQNAVREVRAARGLDISDLRVGVLASDPFMTVLREAVRFPDGSLGLYNRIVELRCVAVLPLLDGKPVMIRIFRHGLRNWSLEFPRGGCDRGEPPEDAARRELREEIGAEVQELLPLGEFTPGGSSLSIRADLYAAHIDRTGAPDRADGIETIEIIPVAKIEALIQSSQIIDGFTLGLFLRARLAGVV